MTVICRDCGPLAESDLRRIRWGLTEEETMEYYRKVETDEKLRNKVEWNGIIPMPYNISYKCGRCGSGNITIVGTADQPIEKKCGI